MYKTKNHFPRNQTWLHQKLKNYYLTKVGGAEEVTIPVNGKKYRIDVFDNQRTIAYEIHRANFGTHFSNKINSLLKLSKMRIVIVIPIVLKQKITRMKQGKIISVGYVNKRTDMYSLFEKLVYFKTQFVPKKMEINVLFIKEHVLKEFIGFSTKSGRRKFKVIQRDLLEIISKKKFCTKKDFTNLLPIDLPKIFTNRELAEKLEINGGEKRKRRFPGIITYSLCRLGILSRVGSRGRAYEFSVIVDS